MKVSLANSVRDGKNINRKKEVREYPDSQLDFWIIKASVYGKLFNFVFINAC